MVLACDISLGLYLYLNIVNLILSTLLFIYWLHSFMIGVLRFGTNESPDHSKPILNYQSIAKMIKLPATTVIELVKAAIDASRYMF